MLRITSLHPVQRGSAGAASGDSSVVRWLRSGRCKDHVEFSDAACRARGSTRCRPYVHVEIGIEIAAAAVLLVGKSIPACGAQRVKAAVLQPEVEMLGMRAVLGSGAAGCSRRLRTLCLGEVGQVDQDADALALGGLEDTG